MKPYLTSLTLAVLFCSSSAFAFSKVNRFQNIIERAATAHQVPPDLIVAVMEAESGGSITAVSNKGALGLMQLIPETARRFGALDPFDPEENIFAASKYLKFLLVMFKQNIGLALAAYHSGHNRVLSSQAVPSSGATSLYVKTVLQRFSVLKLQRERIVSFNDLGRSS